jgi:hypothetical protein
MKIRYRRTNWAEHQKTWWDLPNFIKILVGGYGCGKTWVGSLRAIYLSSINQGMSGICVSPSYQMAKKTMIPTLQSLMDQMELRYTFNISDHKFMIENWQGGFWIASGDDPDSLKGPTLSWYWIDEPFIQKKEVFDQAIFRVRQKDAARAEIFLTGTPEQLNWGYDIVMNTAGNYDVGYVYGKTIDNKHNRPEYYTTIWNAFSEEQRQAYLEGKFINLTQGRAYKPFDRNRHIKHIDVRGFPVCAGLDFNVDYMSAEIFALGNGWVHFIDEIRIGYSNSFELAERLGQKYRFINVYPDATGSARKSSSTKSDHQIFKDAGFKVIANLENPKVMDRLNAVNKLLLHDWLTIEPGKCPHLVTDLERDVFKNGDLDKQSDPALTHAGDAAGYPIAYLFPVRQLTISSHPR